jgi:steroid delta-isomerase-like uncharacterized protein
MSRELNAQLARRWFEEVWNQRKDATVHELLHPEIVAHMEGGMVRAPEDFLAARAAVLSALPNLKVTVEGVVADDEQAVVRWSAAGRHTGSGLGLVASQQPASFRGTTWMVFSDGRIIRAWDSWNQGLLLQQLAAPLVFKETPDSTQREG